jgi:hypothetical protein
MRWSGIHFKLPANISPRLSSATLMLAFEVNGPAAVADDYGLATIVRSVEWANAENEFVPVLIRRFAFDFEAPR